MSRSLFPRLRVALVAAAASALVLVPASQANHKGFVQIDHVLGGAAATTGLNGAFNGNLFSIANTNTGNAAVGVAGSHNASSGFGAGVFGLTQSTTSGSDTFGNTGSFGVLGLVKPTGPGNWSAGVRGVNSGTGASGIGVWGSQAGGGWGVYGRSKSGAGVRAFSDIGNGLEASALGSNNSAAYIHHDTNNFGNGVFATTNNGVGATGITQTGGPGVMGTSQETGGTGILGLSQGENGTGVYGKTNSGCVAGNPTFTFAGVQGEDLSNGAIGMLGACKIGVVGIAGVNGRAGVFDGNVTVDGDATVEHLVVTNGCTGCSGASMSIPNPLDPRHTTLQHAAVQSPEMMNVYSGNVVTNGRGFAAVRLPAYFQALNRDFRYQLTIVGRSFAQALVWREIAHNRFTIRTSKPRVKVSWQLTGIRHDPYANAHRIAVVVPKTAADRAG
jgi:hypothetical protein